MNTANSRPAGWRSALTLALACALLTGCTTTQNLATVNPAGIAAAVHVGDSVKCTLRDGSKAEFKVTSVEPALLRGETRSTPIADITQIEINRPSPGRTAALVTVLVLVTVVILVIAHSPAAFAGGTYIGGL